MIRILSVRILMNLNIVTLIFFGIFVQGQTPSSTATITLQEVALQAPKTETFRNKLPFSLSAQDVSSFQPIYQQLSLQEYLGSVPGLFSQNANNYAQDLRISLRGFGARAAFGIRGIKIIVDGGIMKGSDVLKYKNVVFTTSSIKSFQDRNIK